MKLELEPQLQPGVGHTGHRSGPGLGAEYWSHHRQCSPDEVRVPVNHRHVQTEDTRHSLLSANVIN